MKQYARYPFRVCVNDQFDRLSAPIENRYSKAEVEAWLTRAGLEDVRVRPFCGWIGTGRKAASTRMTRVPDQGPITLGPSRPSRAAALVGALSQENGHASQGQTTRL
jgi:hypothetical protein